jgi:raffinose/stachyose/melibiose transport system substrate-binding protein
MKRRGHNPCPITPNTGAHARPWVPLSLCVSVVSFVLVPGCRALRQEGIVLRMATTQAGEQMREPFRAALRAFEREHPGVHVELVEMDDEVYQKMGLITLFVGGTPPDIYFQWGGYQVRKYAAAGYALDLTADFPQGERERYLPFCWASCRGDGDRLYLWPESASVTTVMWYRVSLFRRLGLSPPRTWEELIAACERLQAAGVIPLALGNRELWPGGNFAAYVVAQYAGVPRYNQILGLEPGTQMDDPGFVAALGFLAGLRRRGFLSRGVSGIGTDEARSLLVQDRGGIDPIGDWLVSEADPTDAADLDAFRLPHIPGQQGDDTTLLALTTGYMIHRGTRHPQEARALLRHLTSDAVQQEFTRHGHMSPLRAAAPGPDAPRGQRRLLEFMEQARATAIAPDVGFNLEVSDAFLDAASLVLGGRARPAEALAGAERQVRSLRDAE